MNFVKAKTIGVLALQGAYYKHIEAMKNLGIKTFDVRTIDSIKNIDGLIIPGGESTAIGKLLVKNDLIEPIRKRINAGMPVFGTCAGMILLAKSVTGMEQPLLGVMDISVDRNAYGRQIDSFEVEFTVKEIGGNPVKGIFIRAPKIACISENIKVLASYEDVPVLIQQGNILAASFHPELSDDLRVHSYFISNICQQ